MNENVKSFHIEASKRNKQQMVLVLTTESGQKYVVAGDHWDPSSLIPYERCFHTEEQIPKS